MQEKSEQKQLLGLAAASEPIQPEIPHLTEEEEQQHGSPTDALSASLAKSRQDPDNQLQMCSVQSLVTLQGNKHTTNANGDKDGKLHVGGASAANKDLLSAGEVDDFSLFQQPIEGCGSGQQETDVNNTFQEINQSVDQVCQDDPDFQSILSNRIRAQPAKDDRQTEEQKTAAQEALLQKVMTTESDADSFSSADSRNHHRDHGGQSEDNSSQLILQQENSSATAGQSLQVAQDPSKYKQLRKSSAAASQSGGHRQKQAVNESSRTARMHNNNSPFSNSGTNMLQQLQSDVAAEQRTSKSSTRQQKRPPISFALPTFSNEHQHQLQQPQLMQQRGQSSGGTVDTHDIFDGKSIAQIQGTSSNDQQLHQTQLQHHQMMQSLQQKLHINLKNLPSNSGGSSSYSNKDLSERLQGIMRQRGGQGQLTNGVSPTLKPGGSQNAWPNDGLDMDSSNRTERDNELLLLQNSKGASGGAGGAPSSLHAAFAGSGNMPPMPANMSQDPYVYLQWRQQKHKSCRSAHPNHQANYLLNQRKAASPGTNARTLRLIQGKSGHHNGGAGQGQVNDSASSFSNSSQTTVPVKSLTEVKNPSNLITFRFVNRKVTHLKEIGRFRNLTELDVNGNLLQSSVPELLNLSFLKKLNLSGNQITEMWNLPKTLEILNISYNCLKKLDTSVMRSLSNLTTLEISNNGIESLEGLENVTRLKRLIARNNQIQSLQPITNLKLLIEMDLENNPIDSSNQVLRAVQNKKDILLLNLKLAPLMVKIQNYDEFIASVTDESKMVQEFKKLLTFLNNGTFYRRKKIYVRIRQQQQSLHIMERRFSNFSNDEDSSNGIATQHNTQSGGAFSRMQQKNLSVSGSGTNPYRRANDKLPGNLGKNQRTYSTGLGGMQGMRPNSSSNQPPQRSQRYEAIISLYDKLLEDEDKLLLQKKRKEARERKLQRQQLQGQNNADKSEYDQHQQMSEEDDDDELDASMDLDDDDDDDLDDDLLSDELYQDNQSYSGEDVDNLAKNHQGKGGDGPIGEHLDDLQTYQNQHFGVELNASTADFNKEIKQINQQLVSEGHLFGTSSNPPESAKRHSHRSGQQLPTLKDASNSVDQPLPQVAQADSPALQQISSPLISSGGKDASSVRESIDSATGMTLNRQESSAYSDQIDAQEINVVVPIEERSSRYTNRQHHNNANQNTSANKSQAQGEQLESSVVRQPQFEHQSSCEHVPAAADLSVSHQSSHSGIGKGLVSSTVMDQYNQGSTGLIKKTPQLSFKLDLAKVKNNTTGQGQTQSKQIEQQTINTTNRGAIKKSNIQEHHLNSSLSKMSSVKITPGESVRTKPNQEQLISVRKIQNQITLAQISERIPIKKNQNKSPQATGKVNLNQSGMDLESSYQSAQILLKKQEVPLQQKQVHIPKLALQNIHRQPSEQSQQNQQTQSQQIQPKSLKVLTLSKRDDSVASGDQTSLNQSHTNFALMHSQQKQSLTIKQSQIVKTLQGKELLDLYEKLDHQRKVINDVKRVLGDTLMTDHCIVDRILALQDAQRSIQDDNSVVISQLANRHQMQIEDLNGHILRLQQQLQPKNAASSSSKLQQAAAPTTTFLDQLEKINESMMISVSSLQQQPQKNIANCSPRSIASNTINIANESHHSAAGGGGGLTLRLKDIRQATSNAATAGVRTTEQQAMLDLLKTTSSCDTGGNRQQKQMAKTGRVQNHHQVQQQPQQTSLLQTELQQQQLLANKNGGKASQPPSAIQTEVPPSKTAKQSLLLQQQLPTPIGKISGRNSRRDSGHNVTMELSSKREYMDQLCQSPTGRPAGLNNNTYEDTNTLERASDQQDILGTGGAISKDARKRKQRIVSDFNPGPMPPSMTDESSILAHNNTTQASGRQALLDIPPSQERKETEKDDSLRRVGFFLEKIKERNSSLQERLNLSFKKSSRLDQSSISYRPTTSFGNKKQALRGALIERECISLTRDFDSKNITGGGTNSSQQQDTTLQTQQQHSKTPNILNQQHNYQQTDESCANGNNNDSQQRLLNWDGRKPQLVRQIPAAHQHQLNQSLIAAQMAKKQISKQNQNQSLVSPTNNYIDFLQTGNLDMNTAAAKKSQQFAQRQQAKQSQPQQQAAQNKSTLSVFEDTANQLSSKQKKNCATVNSTNLADQTDKGPLFSFYQCTEVLHQLSSTNRSGGHQSKNNNPQSSKNRSMISGTQRGSGDYLQQPNNPSLALNIQQQQQQSQYSSLLNKQRSSNTMAIQQAKNHHQSSSLLEHASTTTAQMIKQSSSFIQRANSLEMVPRLNMPKHNNYLGAADQKSSHHLREQYGGGHHHVRPNSGSGAATSQTAYWTMVAQQQQVPHHGSGQQPQQTAGSMTILQNMANGSGSAAATSGAGISTKICGSKTTTAASAAMHVNNSHHLSNSTHHHHNNLLNQSLQAYQRQSKGLLNNSTVSSSAAVNTTSNNNKSLKQQKSSHLQKPKSCNNTSQQQVQKVMGAKNMVDKLQLQLKGITSNPSQQHQQMRHHQQNHSTGNNSKHHHASHHYQHSQRGSQKQPTSSHLHPPPSQQTQNSRKAMQTDRARYQSASNSGHGIVLSASKKTAGGGKQSSAAAHHAATSFNTISQPDIL